MIARDCGLFGVVLFYEKSGDAFAMVYSYSRSLEGDTNGQRKSDDTGRMPKENVLGFVVFKSLHLYPFSLNQGK